MKKGQLVALWIFAVLWTFTLLIWYTTDQYSWGFPQFFQATIFWGIFAFLAHISLAQRKNKDLAGETKISEKQVSSDGLNNLRPIEVAKQLSSQAPFIQKKANEEMLDINPISLNITCVLLLANVIGVAIFVMAGQQYGFYSSSRNIIGSGIIDAILAFNLYRRRPWAKQWIEVRAVLGGIIFTLVGIYQKDILGALLAISLAVALITMLSRNFRWPRIAQGMGILTIVLMVCVGIYNIYLVDTQNRMVREVAAIGDRFFSSQQFHYRISVPDNWTIIQRKDFGKIDKTLESTQVEIVLMSRDGTYFCLILPEAVDPQYGIEEVKSWFVNNLQKEEIFVIENSQKFYLNGHDGFEVYYYQMESGQKRKYITYLIRYENIAITLTAWAFEQNATKAFNEVKQIAKNIVVEE